MIIAVIYNLLFFHLRTCHVIYQCPADATATTGVDKAILRTGIEGVFPIYKLRMKNDIALLALRLQIRQAFPIFQIFGTRDSCRRRSCRQVSRRCIVIMALRTKDTINPTVFMSSKTHIINICCGNQILRHRNGIVPETEIINTIRTLGYSKERFTVCPFHTHHHQVLPIPFDST